MSLSFNEKLERFSKGRCTAKAELRGPTFSEALEYGHRWFPKVAGEFVHCSSDNGFETKSEAIADAVKFRDDCKRALEARA